MSRIAFVTDSTAYLTPGQVSEYDVTVVPLSVIFGTEAFREGVDLSAEEFYRRLSTEKTFPTTSQPPVGEFVEVFERLLQTHDTVLCLLLSGKLSGTLHAAQTASQMVNGDVVVVDSGIASYGIAGPLLDGVKLARQGASKEQILDVWKRELASTEAYFVLDTLEFLHRGGRIGGAAAVFGSLLQIKPILTVVDGRIELFEKVRTHKRAMERALAKLDEKASSGKPLNLSVVHVMREADAQGLQVELAEKYPNVRVEVSQLGPVVGTHTGPGLMALVFYERVEEAD